MTGGVRLGLPAPKRNRPAGLRNSVPGLWWPKLPLPRLPGSKGQGSASLVGGPVGPAGQPVAPAVQSLPHARSAQHACPWMGSHCCCFYPLPQSHFLLHFGYFLGAFQLNSRSKFPWQNVSGDISTSICCLSPLDATYMDANPILSRS